MISKEEAEEYIKKNYILYTISRNDIDLITNAYLAGSEPREKLLQEKDKKITELEQENVKLEGFLEDERMEYYELENFKNNEIKELKDKSKKIISRMIEILEDISYSEDVNINMYDEEIEQIKQFLKELEND